MDVEHRCGVRNPIDIKATLSSPSRGSMPCRVRNLSAGGLFVEFAGRPFHACVIVEVFLKVPVAGAGRRVSRLHRWPAMVVHGLAGGAGLMFDRPHAAEVAAIIGACLGPARAEALPDRRKPGSTRAAARRADVEAGLHAAANA